MVSNDMKYLSLIVCFLKILSILGCGDQEWTEDENTGKLNY